MSKETLGDLEQLVLLAVLRLQPEAYGGSIYEEISDRTERHLLRPAVYVVLRRMEKKGLVCARASDASGARGGRRKKFYRVEPEGMARLKESRSDLLSMWEGLQTVLDEA